MRVTSAMPAQHPRSIYIGPERFLISMDIGTIQSAVSFTHFLPGSSPRATTVAHWPGQAQARCAAKMPTVVSYLEGSVRACGEAAVPDLEDGDSNVAQWLKVHLRPSTTTPDFEIPKLPPGISVELAYTDIMKYLMDNTRTFFERTTPNGSKTWARLCDKMIIVLATPNGWDLREQKILRTVAMSAGLITPENAERLLCFVPEAEAAVHYALAHYQESWLQNNTTFVVIDAGGVTVDVTVYECASTNPLTLREVRPSECVQAGGVFINLGVKKLLSHRLSGSIFDDPTVLQTMLDYFEQELKPKFDGSQSSYDIKFGGIRDTDQSLGISKGTITISTEDLKAAFDVVVDRVVACYTRVLRNHQVKYTVLVGGFGESPYLQRALRDRLGARGKQLIIPGKSSRKSAAEGATIAHIKKFVVARATRATFGGCVRQLYNRRLHSARSASAYIDTDGKTRVDNVFHPWVTKGTTIKQDFAYRLHYHNSWNAVSITKDDLATQLSNLEIEVYAWEGDEPTPRWCKDEKGGVLPGMRLMCTLDADLSALVSSLTVTAGAGGVRFYRVEYDVRIYFQGTSLRASLEWHDGINARQGPISVIPYNADAPWF